VGGGVGVSKGGGCGCGVGGVCWGGWGVKVVYYIYFFYSYSICSTYVASNMQYVLVQVLLAGMY